MSENVCERRTDVTKLECRWQDDVSNGGENRIEENYQTSPTQFPVQQVKKHQVVP